MTGRLAGALVVVLLLVVPACGNDDEELATHPLLDDSPAGAESTPTPTGSATNPSPQPTETAFPQECGQVIPVIDVVNIVAAPMPGVRRIYQNDFPADSGRLERLTCSYGTQKADGQDEVTPRDQPVLEIAVSNYVDAAAATARVEDTVGTARLRGDKVEEIEISGRQVFVIPGGDATSYVLGEQERTYVVTLARDVVPDPAEQVVLGTLVEELLGSSSGS